MSTNKTIKAWAKLLNIVPEVLIERLKKHDISVSAPDDIVSSGDIQALTVQTENRPVLSLGAQKPALQVDAAHEKITVKRKSTPVNPSDASEAIPVADQAQLVAKPARKYHSDAERLRQQLGVKAAKQKVEPVVAVAAAPQEKAKPAVSLPGTQEPVKNAHKKLTAKERRQEQAERENEERLTRLAQKFQRPTQQAVLDIEVPESIKVSELANRCSIKSAEVIKHLFGLGMMATVNQILDQDTAVYIVTELGHRVSLVKNEEERLLASFSNTHALKPRAAVVTVMGHVDHGKTSLLDFIRCSQVTESEAGGITQHIGAYAVEVDQGSVTFLDTPGHEAFSEMRARGADCTDIVVLVVAADDGVMPQTIEAIQHAKAASVPLIVAVNKIDKPGSDAKRVKVELTQHDVLAESLGGDVIVQEVSAKTGQGVPELLESLALQAEVLELKAPDEGDAQGIIVEAALNKGLGPVATVLVQSGCLNQGDIVCVGTQYGRIRSMKDSHGRVVKVAGPSVPVEVFGLSGIPASGEVLYVVETERIARAHAQLHVEKSRDKRLAQAGPKSMEQMFLDAQSTQSLPILNLVIKADTHGSVEAISESVRNMSSETVDIKVIGSGVGPIKETDVNLADASDALLVGFNVRSDAQATRLMSSRNIKPLYFSIIYDLIDQVKATLKGLALPVYSDKIVAVSEVREVFRSSKFGVVAGCVVLNGVLKRNAQVRVLRDGIVIHQGILNSLRREKEDVNEVKSGIECGLGIKDYTDIHSKDQVEAFIREKN